MPNYKETTAEGVAYVRCHTVVIKNNLGVTPVAEFHEECIVSFGGNTFKQPAAGCRRQVEPTGEIAMVDVQTGLPTGAVVTHGELYAILFSLYMQTAAERDAAG